MKSERKTKDEPQAGRRRLDRVVRQIEWLYKDPKRTTADEALRIVLRVVKGTETAHIAMALKHRARHPNNPAGHCGLAKWIRAVLKSNPEFHAPSKAR